MQVASLSSTPHTFFNLLTGPGLLSAVEDLLPEHRERSFPPTETLSMFLSQAMNADRSCQNIDKVSVGEAGAGLALIAGMVYFVGMFVCTVVFNVPLNNALARLGPDSDKAQQIWSHYLKLKGTLRMALP